MERSSDSDLHRKWGVFLLTMLAGGCVSYAPGELAAISDYELCKIEAVQRPNLSAASRSALENELARRKENCVAHRPAIQAQLAAELYERTYFNQSP
jgi:hypothetical protein